MFVVPQTGVIHIMVRFQTSLRHIPSKAAIEETPNKDMPIHLLFHLCQKKNSCIIIPHHGYLIIHALTTRPQNHPILTMGPLTDCRGT
jgi:hypothetical protein